MMINKHVSFTCVDNGCQILFDRLIFRLRVRLFFLKPHPSTFDTTHKMESEGEEDEAPMLVPAAAEPAEATALVDPQTADKIPVTIITGFLG